MTSSAGGPPEESEVPGVSQSTAAMLGLLYYLLVSLPAPLALVLCAATALMALTYVKSLTQPGEVKPTLHYRDSTLSRFILKECSLLTMPFAPVLWFRNTHVQTVLSMVLPGVNYQFQREFLLMKDKGVVALDWGAHPVEKTNGLNGYKMLKKTSHILLILPGLLKDARGVAQLCIHAVQRGFRPVVFNKRGHGQSPLTTPRLQSFGDSGDMRQVVKYIKARYPESKITTVGISDGSGLLMSYLGEYGSSAYVAAAACISPWYDVESLLNHPLSQPYDLMLLYTQKRWLSTHTRALSKTINMEEAFQSQTLAQLEEKVYCQLYGYEDMAQYWERNNPMRDVDEIATPILCINSLDDPIVPKDHIPFDLFQTLPNFHLVTSTYGGHCGFLEGLELESWADKVALEYLEAVLRFEEADKPVQNGTAGQHDKKDSNGKR